MSQSQIEATALLCRLLDRSDTRIQGRALFEGELARGARHLLRERLLAISAQLDHVTCTECRIESARVVREISETQIRLFCSECEAVEAPKYVRHTYRAVPTQLVTNLLNGLGLSRASLKIVVPEMIWRLGCTEPRPRTPCTWYFARMLYKPGVARQLRDELQAGCALGSAVVLTTSEVPLPAGTPLAGFDVRSLVHVGRIGQSTFEFFAERQVTPGAQVSVGPVRAASHYTTLRYTASEGLVYWQGQQVKLTRQQRAILVVLIDDRDHEMDRDALREAAGSKDEKFSPSKTFQRNADLYHALIRFDEDAERYSLLLPDEDRDWLD